MDLVEVHHASDAATCAPRLPVALAPHVLGALLLGMVWTAAPSTAVFIPLLLVAWWRAKTRLEAWAIGAAYQFGATYGLSSGAAKYLGLAEWKGYWALLLLSAFVGLGWALFWLRDSESRGWVVRAAAFGGWLALTISPIGLGALMVAHPLTAAGWLFPGSGWIGLLATSGLFLACSTSRGAWAALAICSVSFLAGSSEPTLHVATGIKGVATASKPALGEFDYAQQFRVAREAMRAAERSRASIVVLPEGSAGTWTSAMRSLWLPWIESRRAHGQLVLVGASLRSDAGGLDNVALLLGDAQETAMPQRLPIPFAMWRPWSESGFGAHFWSPGTVRVRARTLGILVCWEGALVLPALLSAAHGADVFVHQANHAWVGTAGMPTVVASRAWGALFGLPVVVARNAQGGDDA